MERHMYGAVHEECTKDGGIPHCMGICRSPSVGRDIAPYKGAAPLRGRNLSGAEV
jgi:hypothetical protein